VGSSGLFDSGGKHFGRANCWYCNLVRVCRNGHNTYHMLARVDVGKSQRSLNKAQPLLRARRVIRSRR